MEFISISYFRELLEKNVNALHESCKEWEECSITTLPEEVSDEIRTTIGLANLLMRQKLKQFGSLIDNSENKTSEKEITCVDLQGFWDMVYHEVEKIQKSFSNLERCRNNNWVWVHEPISKTTTKKKPRVAEIANVSIKAKAHAVAARQRLAEAKLKMKAQFAKKQQEAIKVSATLNLQNEEEVNHKEDKEITTEKGIAHAEQLKQTLKNVENLQITEKKDLVATQLLPSSEERVNKRHRKEKKPLKPVANKNKENLLDVPQNKSEMISKTQTNTPECSSASGSKRTKEFIPLQCITRSAKKAMLAAQNSSKN